MKKEKALNVTGNIYTIIGAILCFAAIALLAYPQLPFLLNKLNINSPEKEVATLNTPITTEQVPDPIDQIVIPEIRLPDKDTSLIETNTIIISKIGVKAEIITGVDSTVALKKGPWIVPDYANPEQNYLNETSKSIIIASHRFGYSSWSNEYRNRISFFNLPKTVIEDHIVIIWNQREYVYEIFDIDENKYIKEIDSDLILYTCKYYNSPIRIFRFANLISINGNPV
jgi:sortase (surface protein transpeptidase)